jgi:hypothetical protein
MAVDVSTVWWCVRHVSDGGSGLKAMPRSGCSHTAAAVENEVRVDQMIPKDHLIKTQEMCESGNRLYGTENNLYILGYSKLCARWVP